MAFLLEDHEQKIEYVYPFVCGLCGFGSSNIDIFHHHFETHGEAVPSSVFHLCELEDTRNDETDTELNIGSYCCKTCNHTFPTVCHLQKHLDEDSSTDKFIMDLQTKTAYPLTSQCASVLSHSFLGETNYRNDSVNPINRSLSGKWSSNSKKSPRKSPKGNLKARSRGGKSGPKQTSEHRLDLHSFEQLLHQAQNEQKAANTIYSTIEDIDYNDDDYDDDSNVVSLIPEVTIGQQKKKKMKRTPKRTSEPRTKPGEWINCKYCGLSFRMQTKRLEHEEEHLTVEGNLKYAQEKLSTCEKCGCVMLKFKVHLHACPFSKRVRRPRAKDGEPKKTKDKTVVPCPYCSRKLRRYFLPQHIKEIHQEHEPVTCETCGKVFKHKNALNKHMIVHGGEKRFPCSKCTKRFYTRSKLKVHMLMHSDARNYQCQLCPENYKYPRNLQFHMQRVHSKKTEEIFQCELCPKQYNYKDGLGQHMRRVHNIWVNPSVIDPDNPKKPKAAEKPKDNYNCEVCGEELQTKKGLTHHMKSHNIVKEEDLRYLCDECPQRYSTGQSLKRHIERKHRAKDAVNVVKCEHCPKEFSNVDALRMHKSRNHKPGDNWLHCGWKSCRHKFKDQSELEKHRKSHEDAVQFFCKKCGKSFMSLSGLSQHDQRLHPKIYKLQEFSEEELQDQEHVDVQDQEHVDDSQANSVVNAVDTSTATVDVQCPLDDHAYINEEIFTAVHVKPEDCDMSIPVVEGVETGAAAGTLNGAVAYVDTLQEHSVAVSVPSAQEISNQIKDTLTERADTGKDIHKRKDVSKPNIVYVHVKKNRNEGTNDSVTMATGKTVSDVNNDQKGKVLRTLVLKKVTGTVNTEIYAPNVTGKNTAGKPVKLSITSNKSQIGKDLKHPVKILLKKV